MQPTALYCQCQQKATLPGLSILFGARLLIGHHAPGDSWMKLGGYRPDLSATDTQLLRMATQDCERVAAGSVRERPG